MSNDYGENPDPKKERYEIFLAERIYFERKASRLERKLREQKYRDFYNEGRGLPRDINLYPQRKKELLIKYFPKRFGAKGEQPIYNMSNSKIGVLFDELMKYSQKRISKNKNN